MRTFFAAALFAAALAGPGCITVGRGVPYLPDPVYRGITPEMAKKALEEQLRAARTMDNKPLASFTVGDRALTFAFDQMGEHHQVTLAYAECWCGIATDIFMGPKELPYGLGFYKGDVYVDFAYMWFARLEDAQKFVDAYAAMEMAQEKKS